MTLSETPEWEKIENTILYLNNNGVTLSDNLFKQYIYLKNFLEVNFGRIEGDQFGGREMDLFF
jgi:hypothetical protein